MSDNLVNNDGVFRDGDPIPSGVVTQTEKILKENPNPILEDTKTIEKEEKMGKEEDNNSNNELDTDIDSDFVSMMAEDKIKILCTTESTLPPYREYPRKYPDPRTVYKIEKLISKYYDLNNNIKRFNDRNKVLVEKKEYLQTLDPKTNPDKFDRLMAVIEEISQLSEQFEESEKFEIDGQKFESANDYTLYFFYKLVQTYTGCSDNDIDNFSYHTYPNQWGAKGVFDLAVSFIILIQRGPVFLAKKSKK